jgi:hypothetical protein
MALSLLGLSCGAAWAVDDVVIADFEGENFGAWKVTGEAFGKGPAQGPVGQQMPVDGFEGKGYCSSFHGGDAAAGKLVSPPFKIGRKHLKFLIGGGGFAGKTCMNLLYQGRVVRTATGANTQPGGSERLYRQSWDVGDLAGREVTLEIVDQATGGWGHLSVDQIVLSDAPPESPQKELLKEADDYVESRAAIAEKDPLRPIYHVMPKAQFTGDPNGPVFFNGEYHLFFQHMPFWGTAKQGIFWTCGQQGHGALAAPADRDGAGACAVGHHRDSLGGVRGLGWSAYDHLHGIQQPRELPDRMRGDEQRQPADVDQGPGEPGHSETAQA